MNKNFKCIIFDLDGTLIDSGPDLLNSLNHVLKIEGLEKVSKNVLGNLVGGGAEVMIRKGFQHLGFNFDESKMNGYVSDFLEFYMKNCINETKLYDDVESTLKYFCDKKIKICICTNKKQYLTDKIISGFNIGKYFELVLGSSEKMRLKPDQEMLKYCIDYTKYNPEQCIMIGDSDNDIVPANELGILSVYVNYGYGTLSKNVKPNYEVKSVKEIIQVLEN